MLRYGLSELRHAKGLSIMCHPVIQRSLRGINDMLRSGKIRFTEGERENVQTLFLETLDLISQLNRAGRLYVSDAFREHLGTLLLKLH
jgi:hypothetical protein